jgi:hypothetical protein
MTGVPRQRAARRWGWLAAAVALATLTACDTPSAGPTPTPTFSYSSPSPAPTNTTDANGRALPGFVTVSQDLPPAQAAPEGLLATTGPGWSLQSYRPQVDPVNTVEGVLPGIAATVQVVYLVSPEGKRYQLLELDPATPIVIESWSAGDTIAYVTQCDPIDCDPTAPAEVLDLLTGTLSPAAGIDVSMHVGATLPRSVRWWQNANSAAALDSGGHVVTVKQDWVAASTSPDGDYLAVVRAGQYSPYASAGTAIVSTATGLATDLSSLWEEPLRCTPFRWRADDALDVSCWDPERLAWRVFAVGPGAKEMKENKSATATAPDDGPWVQPDFFVTDGVWAGPYTADGAARKVPVDAAIGLARNAGFEQLVVPDAAVGAARIVAVVNGEIFVEATQATNLSLKTAWVYDLASSRWLEIGPLPPAGGTRGLLASEGSPASGMTSFVVAP